MAKADAKKQMTEDELLDLISRLEKASLGSQVAAGATQGSTGVGSNQQMTTLEVDRFNALNMYYARPMGNEVENRSQIVIPELRDTVEWIMPQLMRMFVAAKQVCRFDPEGPQDTQQAEIETQVVNHIFMKENNGFFVLHDFFKDALLLRNGYAKVYAEDVKTSSVERYTGLTEDEIAQLTGDKETVEVLEQREYSQPLIQMGMPLSQIQVFDIKIRRSEKRKKICVECIPPEEMRISPGTRGNLDKSPFAEHQTEKTRSDLLGEGYDKEIVNSATAGRPNWLDMDSLARNQVVDQTSIERPSDFAMQKLEVREATLNVDFDGDGLAELRSVLIVGNKIAENEEIEETPLASCSPIRMPHRHTGISYYDLLSDLQVIKTQLFRQGLDNLVLANNSRIGVDWKNCNIDDLLNSRPGGVVRTNGPPQNSLMPIVQPSNLVEQVIPAMQYVDSLREMRTGVGRDTMGLDADALQDVTKGGQLAAMSAASLKIELVARLLAEGVKDIFTKIHGALIRHQDKPFEFEIAGKWMTVDPSTWRRRTRVTPTVGLGSGNREESRANIALLGNMQEKLAPLGLVGPKQAYETFKMGVEVLGYHNPERFAMDPTSDEYKQHQADMKNNPPPLAPPVQVAQIKAKTEQDKQAAETQREAMQAQKEVIKDQQQTIAQQRQSQLEIVHDAVQGHHDRTQDAASEQANIDGQLMQTFIKAFAQIIASQLKQNATADAGQMLVHDTQEARQGLG